MKVRLRANFFANGRRYRRGEPPSVPVEIPSALKDKLPKAAVIMSEDDAATEAEGDDPTKVFKGAARSGPVADPAPDKPLALSELARARDVLDAGMAAHSAAAGKKHK